MAIITANEVIKYSFAERAYPQDKVSRIMDVAETRFMRNCFGNDFYDFLKADKKNWSNKAEWTAGTYATGDMVWWEDDLYESTQNANTDEPSLVSVKWKAASKFTTSEYDNLWKLYLRPILANEIIRLTAPLETIKFTGKGAVVFSEDQSNTVGADSRSLDSAMRHMKELIEIQKDEMIEYVKLQQEKYDINPATGFDYKTKKVQFLDCDNCNVTTKQGRRTAFKH